jgi:uncharacterized protein
VTHEILPPGSTARTTVKRVPDRAINDRAAMYDILDASLVAQVAVVDSHQPFIIPVAFARSGDDVLFHGSSASRLFRLLAEGHPTCFSVTLLDGLVLARSSFESSMNYRSVMAIGVARALEGDEKFNALHIITDHLLPDRWSDIRPPAPQELKATMVVSLPLSECSVKVRVGAPEDLPEDLADPQYGPVWAGVMPIHEKFGTPIPDERSLTTEQPHYLSRWHRG